MTVSPTVAVKKVWTAPVVEDAGVLENMAHQKPIVFPTEIDIFNGPAS